jgi:hypothetical protein
MKQLLVCWLLAVLGWAGSSPALAQRRPGQALVARPSGARYQRSAAYRDYFRPGRPRYHYGPSRRAYHNRQPYQPQVYYHRRVARRLQPPPAELR